VPESSDVQQMSLDFGDTMPDSGQIGRNLAGAAGSPDISPDHRQSGWIRPEYCQNGRTPGIWPDPAVLVESLANWPETGQDGRLPINWPGSGGFVPDSGKDRWNPATLLEFVYAKYKKIFFIL
jgi:hypothetical protein